MFCRRLCESWYAKVKGSFRIVDQFGVGILKINRNFIYRKKKIPPPYHKHRIWGKLMIQLFRSMIDPPCTNRSVTLASPYAGYINWIQSLSQWQVSVSMCQLRVLKLLTTSYLAAVRGETMDVSVALLPFPFLVFLLAAGATSCASCVHNGCIIGERWSSYDFLAPSIIIIFLFLFLFNYMPS